MCGKVQNRVMLVYCIINKNCYIVNVGKCLQLKQVVNDTEELEPCSVSSDPVTGKQASKPKDIVVFVNVVDFSR